VRTGEKIDYAKLLHKSEREVTKNFKYAVEHEETRKTNDEHMK
jgi:hypothetical protein